MYLQLHGVALGWTAPRVTCSRRCDSTHWLVVVSPECPVSAPGYCIGFWMKWAFGLHQQSSFYLLFFWKYSSVLCHIVTGAWRIQEGGRVLFYTCWKRTGETAGLEKLACNVSYFSDHWISQDSLASLPLLLNHMLWLHIALLLSI